jgi:cytoskeletal protein RodZ
MGSCNSKWVSCHYILKMVRKLPEASMVQAIENKDLDSKKSRIRAGLWLLGSAVFGGVAVALWNRRTLAKMQEKQKEGQPQSQKADGNVIY